MYITDENLHFYLNINFINYKNHKNIKVLLIAFKTTAMFQELIENIDRMACDKQGIVNHKLQVQ